MPYGNNRNNAKRLPSERGSSESVFTLIDADYKGTYVDLACFFLLRFLLRPVFVIIGPESR